MARLFDTEAIVKLVVAATFFVCYGFVYHAMAKDEKILMQTYAKVSVDRFDQLESTLNLAK